MAIFRSCLPLRPYRSRARPSLSGPSATRVATMLQPGWKLRDHRDLSTRVVEARTLADVRGHESFDEREMPQVVRPQHAVARRQLQPERHAEERVTDGRTPARREHHTQTGVITCVATGRTHEPPRAKDSVVRCGVPRRAYDVRYTAAPGQTTVTSLMNDHEDCGRLETAWAACWTSGDHRAVSANEVVSLSPRPAIARSA